MGPLIFLALAASAYLGIVAMAITSLVGDIRARQIRCRSAQTTLLAVAPPLLLYIWLMQSAKEDIVGHVPMALGPPKILYSTGESWGFGPGGASTELDTYEIPEDVASSVRSDGLAFLTRMPPQVVMFPGGGWRQSQSEYRWRETPISGEEAWLGAPNDYRSELDSMPSIDHYLGRWGWSIDIDPAVARQIDEAIHQPGSYYMINGNATLIVIPNKRRVVYCFAK